MAVPTAITVRVASDFMIGFLALKAQFHTVWTVARWLFRCDLYEETLDMNIFSQAVVYPRGWFADYRWYLPVVTSSQFDLVFPREEVGYHQ